MKQQQKMKRTSLLSGMAALAFAASQEPVSQAAGLSGYRIGLSLPRQKPAVAAPIGSCVNPIGPGVKGVPGVPPKVLIEPRWWPEGYKEWPGILPRHVILNLTNVPALPKPPLPKLLVRIDDHDDDEQRALQAAVARYLGL